MGRIHKRTLRNIFLTFIVITGILISIAYVATYVNKNVAQNEYGVVFNGYTMDIKKEVLDQGKYALKFGEYMKTYPATIQYASFENDNRIVCFTSDGMNVMIDIVVQYAYDKTKLIPVMLYDFDNEENYIAYYRANLHASIFASCANFNSDDYYTFRQAVEDNMFKNVIENINSSGIGINVILLQLTNVDFPSEFDEAIEKKQIEIAQLQIQKNNRTSLLIAANTTFIQGQQQAQRIMNQADNTVKIVMARANSVSNVIKNRYYALGDAFAETMINLQLNSTEFLNYLQTEVMRTANYLVTST